MGNVKAIASLGLGPHRRLLQLAARSFQPFARRHGYDLHLHTDIVDPRRPASWSKIPIIQHLLESYEAVLWLDADLVIVDATEDVPMPAFMGLVEHEGLMPNAGVWMLHAGDETRAFLDEVWSQTDLVDHRWWESAAICRLLGYELDPVRRGEPTDWFRRTTWLDPRWNWIPDAPVANPRIRHYPGYKPVTRGAFMVRDLLLHARRG